MSTFRLPSVKQHLLVIGRNGSGKTIAALWHLSQHDLANQVWIVLNHKREDSVNAIPGAVFLKMDQLPPRRKKKLVPGVYIYQPRPDVDDARVTEIMWWIYENGGVGLYIDEGYMINPRDPALTALYTQGRSKETPVITLSQRPSRISRFAVSEAAMHQVFHLVDKRDRKTIQEYIPVDLDAYMVSQEGQPRKLADYHSIYYDVNGDKATMLAPVPPEEIIMETFRGKLPQPEPKKFFFF